MAVNKAQWLSLKNELDSKGVALIAVSKMQPVDNILRLYEWGQRDFGENYVQELMEKEALLPKDIRWHFIGHLQSNKVKYIAPFVHLIHGVDSKKILKEVNKQAQKTGRIINILLQMHIASEETKFGMDESELAEILAGVNAGAFTHVHIKGLMGMASFSEKESQVRQEFQKIKREFEKLKHEKSNVVTADTLSIGMTADYKIAIEEGATMVRIGSMLFGNRPRNATSLS